MKREKFNRLIQFIFYTLFSLFFILGVIFLHKFKNVKFAKFSWSLMSACFIFLGIYVLTKGIYLHSHWYSKKGRFFYGLLYIFTGFYLGYIIFVNIC